MILSVASLVLASLATASFQDSLRPILPGGGRYFWNQKSVVYQHPPAFDFTNVAHAVAYRFDILDDRHDLISFTAAKPTESLAGVWTNVAARGFVTVFCHGVDAAGRDCGAAGAKRTFWKSPPFDPAKCEPGARPYAEAALKQYEFVFSMPHVRKMVETGKLDYTYEHNCYPTKMNVCLIGSALHYGELKPSERERALKIARAAADCLIDLAEPEGTPLAGFTPTYAKGNVNYTAGKYAGQNMLVYPADAGLAYLELYQATGEAKYLKAAENVAATYLRLQGDDGSWYLKIREKDGAPVNPNRLHPVGVLDFLDALFAETNDDRYREAADRAFGYFDRGPLVDWNWEGQFEDVKPSAKFINPSMYFAGSVAIRILRRWPDDPKRVAQAREILRWIEDQFVCWERPYKDEGLSFVGRTWCDWKVEPAVVEQFHYRQPVDSKAAKVAAAFLAMHRVSGDPLDLAKARTLGDACVRMQHADGRNP